MIYLIILASACIAFYLIEVIKWHKNWSDHLDVKPFNCVTCLAGWVGLLTAIIAGFGFEAILALPISAVAGLVLDNAAKRYL